MVKKPRVVIVNEQDEIIGYKKREILDSSDLDKIYRVTGLWLTNSKGEILLARRALNKAHDPGKWGPAAAGTVEEGDTYDSNILKEMAEELGLTELLPAKGPKRRISGKYQYFLQWYTITLDWPADYFETQKEEVAEVRWFKPVELARELREHPGKYLEGMGWALKELSRPTIPEFGSVILVTPDNRIILQLRDNNPKIRDPNCLSLFAGRLHPGEDPEAGARRELYEETDLKVTELEFFMTYQTDMERYGRITKCHAFIARDIDPKAIHVREGQGYRLISGRADLEKYDFALISKEILEKYFDAQTK